MIHDQELPTGLCIDQLLVKVCVSDGEVTLV